MASKLELLGVVDNVRSLWDVGLGFIIEMRFPAGKVFFQMCQHAALSIHGMCAHVNWARATLFIWSHVLLQVCVRRGKAIVYEGKLSSLRRLKDAVEEVGGFGQSVCFKACLMGGIASLPPRQLIIVGLNTHEKPQ